MSEPASSPYVSRGGRKLAAALDDFDVDVVGRVCADLGSHVGGFVDCLLQAGAAKVYSVDTAYGLLAWKLRKDPRVVVVERTNAMHVTLAEPVAIVTVDVGWTTQSRILPNVADLLTPGGRVITLIKPQYEADAHQRKGGVVPDSAVEEVIARTLDELRASGWEVLGSMPSPIRGHGGNREQLALLARS